MKKKKKIVLFQFKVPKVPKQTVNKDEFVRLGWFLIRQRLLYYNYPEYEAHISDKHYDKLEEKYKQMCRVLKEKPTAIEGSEPIMTRPSVRMVDDAIRLDIQTGILRKRK